MKIRDTAIDHEYAVARGWVDPGSAPTGLVSESADSLYTSETDTTKRLAPDGVGGVLWHAGLVVQDEGTPLTTAADTINFVGAGVTATGSGATKTVTIPGATGTVTSVALTAPAEFSVSGSPITTSGTIAITKANESANTVWAGPTSGADAAPTFRALVPADIPSGVGTTDHEHINSVEFNGDGVTTAFELPAAPFDAYSVIASVAGVIQDVTLSNAMLTTMTFASAPASGTNNVRADIVAAVA